MIAADELVEYAQYVNNYYGTPKTYVEKQLAEGKNVILEIEIQGALLVKEKLPETKIYVWTGFLYEDLLKFSGSHIEKILGMTDVLIDGPYIESLRDITLPMRGSSN